MYNAESMVNKLTDGYVKDKNSNNYKLFSLLEKELQALFETQRQIRVSKNIDNMKGETLDRYADNLGIKRKGLTDDVFRIMVKAKALRNNGNGTFNSVTKQLAYALNMNINDVKLEELYSSDGKTAYVGMNNIPFDVLNKLGITIPEYEELFRSILPVGIGLYSTNVEGTFAFSSLADQVEKDNNAGFADDNQTFGGTLGASIGTVINEKTIKL